jgi:hypothetical protein
MGTLEAASAGVAIEIKSTAISSALSREADRRTAAKHNKVPARRSGRAGLGIAETAAV